jgi:hypothetical protein
MKTVIIKGTDDTPCVILDKDNNIFEFSGMSLPEDAKKFYAPIIKWIEQYTKSPNDKTNIVFKLNYINTPSAINILDVLMKFEKIYKDGKDVIITWYYHKYDNEIKEEGEEYSKILNMPIKIVCY